MRGGRRELLGNELGNRDRIAGVAKNLLVAIIRDSFAVNDLEYLPRAEQHIIDSACADAGFRRCIANGIVDQQTLKLESFKLSVGLIQSLALFVETCLRSVEALIDDFIDLCRQSMSFLSRSFCALSLNSRNTSGSTPSNFAGQRFHLLFQLDIIGAEFVQLVLGHHAFDGKEKLAVLFDIKRTDRFGYFFK